MNSYSLLLLCGLALLSGYSPADKAEAYQVYEEPEEGNDESTRGKRQQSSVAVIDSIFNIPIQALKQTSAAAQNWSPQNAGTIDSVLKIPVTTLQAVSELIKNRRQQQETTPLSPTRRPSRRYDTSTQPSRANELERQRRDEIRKRVEAQREQQRLWQTELAKRRFAKMQQFSRRMQEHIVEEGNDNKNVYKDPFGFSAISEWMTGSRHPFNSHAGNGDGHVYQFYNAQKPLHFGGQQQQVHNPIPTKPTLPITSTSAASAPTTSTADSTSPSPGTSTSTTTTTQASRPTSLYAVHELVDEGPFNPFSWPNWFGVINALAASTTAAADDQSYSVDDRIQNKIATKKSSKVKFYQAPAQNRVVPKDGLDEVDIYKIKYVQAKKNNSGLEAELTGNEIDGDVHSGENGSLESAGERQGKVSFPSD